MTTTDATLITFYEQWKLYQDHLQAALAPLTPAQLLLRAAPALAPIGQITAHVIAARAYWFGHIMGEGDAAFRALASWDDPGQLSRTAADLGAGLDQSWALIAAALGRWTAADMAHTFPNEGRGTHYDNARSWVLWHVLEHDLHHGGEISLTLGAHGLQAPDI